MDWILRQKKRFLFSWEKDMFLSIDNKGQKALTYFIEFAKVYNSKRKAIAALRYCGLNEILTFDKKEKFKEL